MVTGLLKWSSLIVVIALLCLTVPPVGAEPSPFTIEAAPQSGPIGTTITVFSTGAPPSAPITVLIGNLDGTEAQVVGSTTSDPLGNFQQSFDLRHELGITPGTFIGIFAVANPGMAPTVTSNIVAFAVNFDIAVSPTSGTLGTTVNVSSNNAPPNAGITVYTGNADGTGGRTVVEGRSDGQGVFRASFVVGQAGGVERSADVGIFAVADTGGLRQIKSNVVVFEVRQPNAPITFTNLQPGPWSTVVTPGFQRLGAEVISSDNIKKVTMQLTGFGTILTLGPQGTAVDAFTSLDLPLGSYTLTMTASDSAGREFTAQWDFVVGSNGESQWFTTAGAVKSADFNATMQSLVQAFRYHLFGESWDHNVPHPEIPTHASAITEAPPLGVWAPQGGTLDEQYTTETLTSLVQAFRWHLFGVSWQSSGTPDMVTHATTFTGPQPIQPWFDSAGNPIRGNIEATLTSLVQAMRWHFWGYSWDGEHHDDIPTHQPGV